MRSGRLRHRLTVQRPQVNGDDEYGAPIPMAPLVLVRVAHGDVQPLSGREFYEGQQVNADVNRRVTLRWQPALRDLHPKDQILFQGRVLDIEYIANVDERNRELEVMCREQL